MVDYTWYGFYVSTRKRRSERVSLSSCFRGNLKFVFLHVSKHLSGLNGVGVYR